MGRTGARPANKSGSWSIWCRIAPRVRSPSPSHRGLARDAHHILRKSGKPDLRSGEGGECAKAQRGARAGWGGISRAPMSVQPLTRPRFARASLSRKGSEPRLSWSTILS